MHRPDASGNQCMAALGRQQTFSGGSPRALETAQAQVGKGVARNRRKIMPCPLDAGGLICVIASAVPRDREHSHFRRHGGGAMGSKLRQSEEKFRLALDAAGALVYEVTADGDIVAHGLELCAIFALCRRFGHAALDPEPLYRASG